MQQWTLRWKYKCVSLADNKRVGQQIEEKDKNWKGSRLTRKKLDGFSKKSIQIKFNYDDSCRVV